MIAVSGDAVGAGLVESLVRPGGNVTGLTTMVSEVEGKRLELLLEILPKLARITVLKNDANPLMAIQFRQTAAAAKSSRVALEEVDIRAVDDSERRSRPQRRLGPTRSSLDSRAGG